MKQRKELVIFQDKDGIFKAISYENKIVEIDERYTYDALRIMNYLYPEFDIIKKVNSGEVIVKITKSQILQKLKAKQDKIKVNNVTFYPNNINKCKNDVETGRQIKLHHADYKVGKTLYATTDIGKKRKNQEDSVIILEHPKNPDFKLIAVSDGVGSSRGGELASNHIVKKLSAWFENIDTYFYNDIVNVQEELSKMLKTILDDLDAPYEAQATLSSAIICKDKTLITNIGDSGVYSEKAGVLTKQTRDDSIVQAMLDQEEIPVEQIMRFHRLSNQITNAISRTIPYYMPHFKIIKNSSYDKVMAMTDGITDSLSKNDIKNIINISNEEQITKNLVMEANNSDTFLIEEIEKLHGEEKRKVVKQIRNNPSVYYDRILGGKDNSTIAAYIKK